jgi:hypothetical protein
LAKALPLFLKDHTRDISKQCLGGELGERREHIKTGTADLRLVIFLLVKPILLKDIALPIHHRGEM